MKKSKLMLLSVICMTGLLVSCGGGSKVTSSTVAGDVTNSTVTDITTSTVTTNSATSSNQSSTTSSTDDEPDPSPSPVVAFNTEMLESAQGNVFFAGSNSTVFTADNETYESYMEVVMADGYYANYEVDVDTGEELYDYEYYRDGQGQVIEYDDLGYDNILTSNVITDNDESPLVFDDNYKNPFDTMTVADFENTDTAGEYSVVSSKIDHFAQSIVDYNRDFVEANVTVDDGMVIAIELVSDVITSTYGDYMHFFYFEIVEQGASIVVPEVLKPAEGTITPAHTDLTEALAELAEMNFTVSHHETDGEDEYSYGYKFTPTATYCDYMYLDDPENPVYPYGFVEIEGTLYDYEIREGVVVPGSEYPENSIDDTTPIFDVAPAFFESEGDGVFTVVDGYAAFIAEAFAEDLVNARDLAPYATDLTVTLVDGHVGTIEYTYGGDIGDGTIYSVDVTMTFTDIGTTTIDFDFSPIAVAYSPISIADAQAANAGDVVRVQGVVVAVTAKSFLVSDDTEAIVVWLNATPNVSEGDVVIITGELSERNGNNQFTASCEITVTGNETVYYNPTVWTSTDFQNFVDTPQDERECGTYVSFEGTLNISGNGRFYNIVIDGLTTIQGSLSNLTDEQKKELTSGETYHFAGYVIDTSVSGSTTYVNIYLSMVSTPGEIL